MLLLAEVIESGVLRITFEHTFIGAYGGAFEGAGSALARIVLAREWLSFLGTLNTHNLHDFEIHSGNLFGFWVVGHVYSRALEVFIGFFSQVLKRYIVAFKHNCVVDPFIAFTLNVACHSRHIQLIELLVLLQHLLPLLP